MLFFDFTAIKKQFFPDMPFVRARRTRPRAKRDQNEKETARRGKKITMFKARPPRRRRAL